MTVELSLNDIKSAIHASFRNGPPNGWLLQWDTSRGQSLIQNAVAPNQVINHTSFDYGFCNWFEVRFTDNTPASDIILTAKLSFILPVCWLDWKQSNNSGTVRTLSRIPEPYRTVEENLRHALHKAGFVELPDEWYRLEVNGVELELSGNVNVTIEKCLFTDYEG